MPWHSASSLASFPLSTPCACRSPSPCANSAESLISMNWLSQIFAVVIYNLRTIPERKGSALTAAVGIAGVVLVLVGVLAIAAGFKRALTSTGSKDIAIVLRAGSDNEMNSGLTREDAHLISDSPGLARSATGPLASAELFVIIDLPKRSTGTDANVPMRGVSASSFDVRG